MGWVIDRFFFFASPQKKVVILAGLLFALIGIIPPWTGTLPMKNLEWSYGYAPVFDPPSQAAVSEKGGSPLQSLSETEAWGAQFVKVHIDYGRLLVQWAVVIAVVGVGLFVAKK